jgi:Glyoxalase-like domain
VRETDAQVGEALRAEQQLADDEQRPAVADDVERAGDAAAVAVSALLCVPLPSRAGTAAWMTEAFGPATLFRLPGYVGGEPSQPVSREVVAAMMPSDGDARWAVDFWIADADTAARAATERGGRVLDGPSDAPPFRRAVLADPAGADFSVSQLVTPPG